MENDAADTCTTWGLSGGIAQVQNTAAAAAVAATAADNTTPAQQPEVVVAPTDTFTASKRLLIQRVETGLCPPSRPCTSASP